MHHLCLLNHILKAWFQQNCDVQGIHENLWASGPMTTRHPDSPRQGRSHRLSSACSQIFWWTISLFFLIFHSVYWLPGQYPPASDTLWDCRWSHAPWSGRQVPDKRLDPRNWSKTIVSLELVRRINICMTSSGWSALSWMPSQCTQTLINGF